MRKLLLVIPMLLTLTSAFAEKRWDEIEISSRADRLINEITNYQREVSSQTGVSGFTDFLREVSYLCDSVASLKRDLYGGFDKCSPMAKRLKDDFKTLSQKFDYSYASHPSYLVRLGWNQIKIAYLELEWSVLKGRP